MSTRESEPGKSFFISRHFSDLNLSVFKFPVYVVNKLVSNMNLCGTIGWKKSVFVGSSVCRKINFHPLEMSRTK